MSQTQDPGLPGNIDDPEDVIERHRDAIEEAIDQGLPGSDRLQKLIDEFGGDAQ